jgi:hypothetical protein
MTLEDVKSEFQLWRTSKVNKSEPIPEVLWQKVYAISKNYTQAQICQALKFNCHTFQNNVSRLASTEFIEIPAVPNPEINNDICQIKLTHGNKVLSFELAVDYMDRVIPSLEKLMQ